MRYWWTADGGLEAIPQCSWCDTLLIDAAGNPRWEIFDELTFVCYEGCRAPQVRRYVDTRMAVGRKQTTGRGKRVMA